MFHKRPEPYFLIVFTIGAILAACGGGTKLQGKQNSEADSLSYEQQIAHVRSQIKAPQFPDKNYMVTTFGAVGDGKTSNTEAFKKAIEACSKKGGGRVVVPQGTFLTGAIYLKSNVNLHLAENATILFSSDTTEYPLVFTRWEGMELMNYSPFIYAYGEKNIAITGKGVLDGGANNDTWWKWNGSPKYGWKAGMPKQTPARDLLHQQNHAQRNPRKRIYGPGHYLRPQFVQSYNCKNVLIEGVTLINSPMWNLNPVLCENVTVRDVRIETLGPNNDGCDPESCKNVLIDNCYFDTGDDCIAIKSGRNEDGRRINKPSENIIIENCTMKNGHGGEVIGSEISGGARNIYALNNVMSSPDLDRVLRIKTSSQRGGVIENIYMKDVKVGTYKESAVHVNMFYEEPGQHMPVVRNVYVENMVVGDGGKYGVYIRAYEQSPVQNLKLVNCTINGVEIPVQMDFVKEVSFKNVKINGAAYTQNSTSASNTNNTRPRVIVSSDIGGTDPDDFQSIIHYFMYADRFQTEGLIASPYGEGRKSHILKMIDLYEKDYPKLKAHSARFPSPNELRAVTKQGAFGAAPNKGWSIPTEGSEWIIKAARKESSQPLWVLVWGGLEDVAQALHDAPDIQDKIRVYWIGGPNKKWSAQAYNYIAQNFPNLWMIESNATYRGWIVDSEGEYDNRTFYEKHIKGQGAMAADFVNHYKGIIKMGDTPTVAYLLFGNPDDPTAPSWGGSYIPLPYSTKRVFQRQTTVQDSLPVFGILEWVLQGPERPQMVDTAVIWAEIDRQRIEGFYEGDGRYRIRFAPKEAKRWKYTIVSDVPELNGKSGQFTSTNSWPGKPHPQNITGLKKWWSDKLDAADYEGVHQGAKTILRFRQDYLKDWAERWSWLSN